ncbi:hypothetical protein O1611_g9915 [Lasiodiplodia mahajangana]|uniref:Uncharacterized protein n=1 Tax=Lasiodiplodia mahajangana TaxID=1108764 RepID=A0ACC2J3W0_9PEZI|nr:hypothetical protein O1611_g9915 [Lasiodiplodia mahajangana]
MRSLLESRQEMRWLQSREPTVPALCYDTCNNANIEAQAVGKTPELCAADSGFWSYYNDCVDCVKAYSNNDTAATQDSLDPTFGQFIDYCDSMVPETTVITIETTEDGHKTVWSFTKTYTPLSRESIAAVTSATPIVSETSAPNPVDTPTPESTQRSRAWIAGPVIGGVVGVVVILVAVWLLLRVKRKRRRGYEVHGDSAFKSELEVKAQPQELDGQGPSQRPAELPSNAP